MHCYVPNFEEVEGVNWFGPVRLSVHLPPPQKKMFFLNFRFGFLVKNNLGLFVCPSIYPFPHSPPPPQKKKTKSLTLAPAPHPLTKKMFFFFFLDFDSVLNVKNPLTLVPPPLPEKKKQIFFFD